MVKTVKLGVEVIDGRIWGFRIPSCGAPSDTPVNAVLRWVLEQVNFGNWECAEDSKGRVTWLTIGSAAAANADVTTLEEVADNMRVRFRAINFAGIFARGREEGFRPEYSTLAEKVRMTATEAAYDNTETHYAFELLDILERIRAKTFVFTSPPIHGMAAPEVVSLLREATRAYLFNLRRSCVSLCRALLEKALRDRVSDTDLLNERFQSKKGELECLINIAARRSVLTPRLSKRAHAIRKAGNQALHGTEPGDEDAWGVLLDTRGVIEAVCS